MTAMPERICSFIHGAGTDATRVASYNPWVSLYWLVPGKTVGGVLMYPETKEAI